MDTLPTDPATPSPAPAVAPPSFFGLPSAASLLYLLSAACLLGGAALVLAPGGADEGRVLERLAMIGTCLLYQGALLAVALLVCRWRHGNDDAIALSALLAALAGGGAATLDTVAYHRPDTALALGMLGAVIAGTAGVALARRISGPWPLGLPLALVVALGIDHLLPGLLGRAAAAGVRPDDLLIRWNVGWYGLLASALAVVVFALHAQPAAADAQEPLVRRGALRWSLALVVIGTAGLHLWLLAYAFDLPVTWCDALPLAVLVLAAIDLLAWRWCGAVVAPLAVVHAALAMLLVLTTTTNGWKMPLPGTDLVPGPWWLVAGGCALAVAAFLRREAGYALVAACWLALGAATLTSTISLPEFRAGAAGLVLLGAMSLAAAWLRSPRLATAVFAVAWFGAAMMQPLAAWLMSHGLFPGAVALFGAAGAALALAAWRPGLVPHNLLAVCAILIAGSTMALTLPENSALHAPYLASAIAALGGAGLGWRTRRHEAWIPPLLPLGCQMPMLLYTHLAWFAVLAAFGLLGVGVLMSWRNARGAG
jgi:hypothetical protein